MSDTQPNTTTVPGLTTRIATIESVAGSQKHGISIIRLSDGSALRIHSATARAMLAGTDNTRPVHTAVAYDVDAAGNRFNPRVATPLDISRAQSAAGSPLASTVRRIVRDAQEASRANESPERASRRSRNER